MSENHILKTFLRVTATLATATLATAAVASLPASAQDATLTSQDVKTLAARPVTGDAVIATVNGLEIFASELVFLYQDLPAQYRQRPLQEMYGPLLNRLIDRKLLAAKGRADGLLDEDATLRRVQYAIDGILQQAYVREHVIEALTQERLQAAYDTDIAGQSGTEEIEARHILVRTRAEGEAVIEALGGGADFATLAQEKSVGPSASAGGALGFFGRGQMVPAFEEAAFSLEAGTFSSEPVESKFGWHVIKVEQRRQTAPPSFAEALPELQAQETNAIVEEMVAEMREGAVIEEFPPEGLTATTESTPPE